MDGSPTEGWEDELERWLAPFLERLRRQAQRRWAPVYLKGLLLPGERKSVEPLAARVAPGSAEQLHHLIGGSPWATAPCVVPGCRGASSREQEDALWHQVFTAQPARRREFEPSSKRRKRRPAPWPPATA